MHAKSQLGITIGGPDDLISGNIRTQPVTLADGTYVRGDVLALSGNIYSKVASGSAANAAAVVAFDTTLSANTEKAVYIGGDFNQDALRLNGAALADVKTALRKVGIMVRKWGAAPDAA